MDKDVPVPSISETLRNTEQRSSTRCCFLLHVRVSELAEYLDVHQHVWAEMREALSRCGWRNYSLFVDPDTGLVVGYFEADDAAAAQSAMAATEVNARWQAAMKKYFVVPDGGTNQDLPQYFYLA